MAEKESSKSVGRSSGSESGPRELIPPTLSHASVRTQRILGFIRRGGTLLVVVLLVLATVAPTFTERTLEFEVNRPAPVDLRAPFDLNVVNSARLRELQAEAKDQAPRLYLFQRRGVEMAAEFESMLNEAIKLANEPGLSQDQQVLNLLAWYRKAELEQPRTTASLELALEKAEIEVFRKTWRGEIVELLDEDHGIVRNHATISTFAREGKAYLLADEGQPVETGEPITEERARQFTEHSRLDEKLRQRAFERKQGNIARPLADLLIPFLPINVVRQAEREEVVEKRLIANVRRPMERWLRGTVIVAQGSVVDHDRRQVLDAFNERIRTINAVRLVFFVGLVLAMMAFVGFYVAKFERELSRNVTSILAISSPVIIPLVVGWLLLTAIGQDTGAAYAFPAALAGMLGVLIVEPRFAMILVLCASLLFGIATGVTSELNFVYLLVSLAGGFSAVSSLFVVRRRSDMLVAGMKAGLVSFVSVLGVSVLSGVGARLDHAWWGLAGGIFSGLMVYPCLLLLEKFAGITTDIGLMELTSLRHPLLAQLEERAPGTFQHTLNVSKLAEAAAVAIGANYLLVRAGCMFHDIGKMDKPKYFSENQVSPEDRRAHDKLSPHMSALIIKDHVRNGILKAREHGLPQRVIDFIPEHHGTTTIQFFYMKALKNYEESESNDPVRLQHFQYAGPRPQSRETAIVLIADSVDAVAGAKLSGATVSRDDVRRLVRDVINQKFREEQFDECHLTLRDLSTIQDALVRTLEARYHHRVKYPEPAAKRKAATSISEVKSRTPSESVTKR